MHSDPEAEEPMTRRAAIPVLLLLCSMWPECLRADGFIRKLPEDGTWCSYDVDYAGRLGPQMRRETGRLIIRSVGRVTDSSEPGRWIEVELETGRGERKNRLLAKVLVPEKHLKAGATPLEHVVRGWLQENDAMPVALEDAANVNRSPLPLVLAGPLKQPRALPAETIACGVGTLLCSGTAGRLSMRFGSKERPVDVSLWTHEKAPFGVVRCRMAFQFEEDDGDSISVDMTFTLREVGTDAVSALKEPAPNAS